MNKEKYITKDGHKVKILAHSYIQRTGMRAEHLFIAEIDGKIVNGKMFRRWEHRTNGSSRLGYSFHNLGKLKKSKYLKDFIFNRLAMAMLDELPEHPLNGHYICMGTDELNTKYKSNKPKGIIKLPREKESCNNDER